MIERIWMRVWKHRVFELLESADFVDGPIDMVVDIELDTSDPFFSVLKELDAKWKKKGGLITAWKYTRSFSEFERRSAQYFQLIVDNLIPIFPEEFGTEYDEESMCNLCRSGRKAGVPLAINRKSIRGRSDILITFTQELIFSRRLCHAWDLGGLSGAVFQNIVNIRSGMKLHDHCHVRVEFEKFRIASPTAAAETPLSLALASPCPICGRQQGANQISPLFLKNPLDTLDPIDLGLTFETFGLNIGSYWPSPAIIVSSRAADFIVSRGFASGCRLDPITIVE